MSPSLAKLTWLTTILEISIHCPSTSAAERLHLRRPGEQFMADPPGTKS